MAKFLVEGGRPLNGVVNISGNKNEALPAIIASLLTDEEVLLKNVPKIGDVLTVCDILKDIGTEVYWHDDETLSLKTVTLKGTSPSPTLCAKARASILLLGPILARAGKIRLASPGGDVIGARRIDSHFEGLTALGAELTLGSPIEGCLKQNIGADIFLDEPSVTATENILMMATLAEGRTVLYNAACEPHVQGLCHLLNSMGAKITGIGSNVITIDGVANLSGTQHEIGPDFMEVGSYLCLGAITEGTITLKNTRLQDLRFILKTFHKLGIDVNFSQMDLEIADPPELIMKPDLSGRISTIYSSPWPGFPTDLMSVAIVAATQAKGTVIFFEKMYEGRMFFTDALMSMGANIVLCDPHRVVITGKEKLVATQMSSPDVRAGMALLMAALIAKGTSQISNIYQIERGYFNVHKKLEALGAAIKRVD